MTKHDPWLWAAAAVPLLLAGCRAPGYGEREEDAARFRRTLQEETEAYFAAHNAPLALADALALARARTLKLTQEQLNRQLAQVQRATAFAAFLPQVEATFARQASDVPVRRALGGMTVQMNDQYVNNAAVTLTQPLFTPGAWLLFSEAKKALRSQDLVRARAEELLDVQVASLFYQAAVSGEMLKTYERQREATRALAEQIGALVRHGYALPAEQARVQARLASDALRLRQAGDALTLARARLFEILRFWPLAQAAVDGGSMTAVLARDWILTGENGEARRVARGQVPELPAEELLWQALVNRKELWAGDQMVAVRKAEVLRALAGFLPSLYGSVSANGTSESSQLPARYWGGGLGAALSVFNGFQTVNAYREAKARRRAEFQAQEDRALTLLVSAFEAHQNWRRSFEQREVAAQGLRAAELDYQATQARHTEEQETLSEVLDKLAALEDARVQAVAAEYACALAEIVLRDAAGVGLMDTRVMEKQAADAFNDEGLLEGLLKKRD
jgi:outer membrane protein TolC